MKEPSIKLELDQSEFFEIQNSLCTPDPMALNMPDYVIEIRSNIRNDLLNKLKISFDNYLKELIGEKEKTVPCPYRKESASCVLSDNKIKCNSCNEDHLSSVWKK
jgi:hypothetical protein